MQRQYTKDNSPPCFGPLEKARRGSWLLKLMDQNHLCNSLANQEGCWQPKGGVRRPPHPSLVLTRLISIRNPCPVTSDERACVCVSARAVCALALGCGSAVQFRGRQSPLHLRSGTGRYVLRQGDAVEARHAALIFLLPLCTTMGFSHYTALNVFLGCVFCFNHELAA